MGPLSTVKQELLVRYLDAWTPTALHGAHSSTHRPGHARRLTYIDGCPAESAVVSALRVFAEFADVLEGHRLTVLLAGDHPAVPPGARDLAAAVDGLEVRAVPGDLLPVLRADQALATPVFAYLDSVGAPPPAAGLLAALGAARAAEVFLATPAHGAAGSDPGPVGSDSRPAESYRQLLRAAGFSFAVVVELVADTGQAELLFFATSAVRNLERFKDELWAVDEYAGVRYRDPRLPDHQLLDISLEPQVGPLRRVLLAQVARDGGGVTVARLREYALTETVYRPADVNRALAPLLAAGQLVREPARGRLTPRTVLRAPAPGSAPGR